MLTYRAGGKREHQHRKLRLGYSTVDEGRYLGLFCGLNWLKNWHKVDSSLKKWKIAMPDVEDVDIGTGGDGMIDDICSEWYHFS